MLTPSLEGDPDPAAADEPAVAHPGPERRRRRARRRRVYRRIAVVVVVLMVPVGYSYARALSGPGSDSVGARSVEWMREHHLGRVVNSVERRWYNTHQAKVGGTPDVAVATPDVAAEDHRVAGAQPPAVAPPLTEAAPTNGGRTATTPPASGPSVDTPPATSDTSSAQPSSVQPPTAQPRAEAAPAVQPPTDGAITTAPASTTPLTAPAPLQTPAGTAVQGEGQWTPIGPPVGAGYGAYGTLIRPDDVHTSVLDAVVWIDPHVLALRQYPGAKIPGAPWDRPDHVETSRQQQLVAAFEGGFRLADSHGGMILGGTTLAPMRDGAATLTIDTNGVANIGQWGRDVTDSPALDSARQNLDLIVDDGAPVPTLLQDPNRTWGFTGPANKSAVWRSGAGITADGALVWVGGPGLAIQTLAETLVRAGAVRGMQLDINHEWVQLNTYSAAADGTVSGRSVLPEMQHTGNRWLTEDTRDFIAVFTR